MVAAMRALLGAFQGAYEPVAFSMIADQIPEKNQSVAKSVLLATPLVGGGMTAMNIMLIGAIGWRKTVSVMGIIGLIYGVASLLFMKNPEKKIEQEVSDEPIFTKFKNSFKTMWANPVTRYCSLAGAFTNVVIFSCDYFMPLYFILSYP